MADAEDTPETIEDEVATAAGAGAGEPSAAGAEQLDQRAPAGGVTRRERLEQRRAARRAAAAAAPPKTLEERLAERAAQRERNARQRRAYRARQKAKRAEQRAAQPAREPAHAPEHGPGRAKVRQGVVVSDKADKTIVVRIDIARRHKRYRKILRTSTTLHAHDERNDAHAGDTVRVVETRPMSRTKRWRLTEIVERAR